MTSLAAPTPCPAPAAPSELLQPPHPAPALALGSLPWLATGLRDLARERPLTLTVRGDCMAPRLRDGDRVTVTPARSYWPGDVVAFHTPQGRIAVHRLLGYRLVGGRLAWVTRGDRCASPDPPPGRELWLGRAAVPPTAPERVRAVLELIALSWRALRRRLAR